MTTRPFAITLDPGSSGPNETGAWRVEQPVYRQALPPCQASCPAGEAVRDWLYAAEDGSYEAAWRRLMRDNPLPAVMGRICYHPCESACNRGQLDEAVGINSVERFLGDEAIRQGWSAGPAAAPTGRRVLIVGSGPAGLSAAYQLALLGHEVTVREAEGKVGGMLRYGIPRYRLPREVLDAEIARIAGLGVTFETDRSVRDLDSALDEEGFDAVFLAVGAPVGKHAEIPAGDGARVLDALGVLAGVEDGEPIALGRVAVYGGGNTAMDVARTVRRLGSSDPVIIYRRTRDRMPAHEEELEDALAEGIRVRWLSTITRAEAGVVTVERMELDESGFPQPTGEHETLRADAVILALGQDSRLDWLAPAADVRVERGTVAVDPDTLATGRPGVYAGGDAIGGERTATHAIGHGARAARAIDRYLRGLTPPTHAADERPVPLDSLNSWYYSDAPATVRPRLEAARRADTFAEVVHGLSEADALFEARRCLSCGNCFGCDNCYGVCPDNAISKLGFDAEGRPLYEIDLDHCKGCGLCAAECPAGAIAMVPEPTEAEEARS
ncbi:NAD(P)-binding protein [Actinospica sp. MGRD01-02]|uniref:NAD(P)-binding protein n=1 Tax=Actinospica acidithermotolerans TaxID=2828514 RepID=A0A941EAT2_9ACTN|nr:NAD(P)-binding protein [Actinospica acidithermotolerans]MBR7825639.1 NAD(P)-binding protein [Actinospica acidithermotolerans]